MNDRQNTTAQNHKTTGGPMIVVTAIIATFMAGMDSTIANLAIPVLKTSFQVDIADVQWVITAYSLTMAVFTPLAAFLANRFGRKRPFVLAMGLFSVGSLLVAFSTSLAMLIVARVVQAIGGSALLALGMMIALGAFPTDQRGRAMAWFGIPSMIAPATGPIVGGYLMSVASWHAAFLINVPFGVIGVVLAIVFIKDFHSASARPASFDFPGFLLIGVASAGVTFAVSESASVGWTSILTEGSLIGGLLLLIGFVVWNVRRSRTGREAIVDLRLFRHRSFWSGSAVLAIVVFAMFGPLLLVPLYLLSARGMSVFHAGLIMTWNAIAAMMAAFAGGRLVDRFGGRVVVVPGIAIFAIDSLLFAGLTLHTSFVVVAALLFLRGIGSGLTTQPLLAASLHDVPQGAETAHASTLAGVMRNLIGGAGVAVIAAYVQIRSAAHAARLVHQGYVGAPLAQLALTGAVDDSFWLFLVLFVCAGLFALFVLPKAKAPGHENPR